MSRYNRCKECYNMDCIFVTGEREDIDTSKCADFRSMTNADRIRAMSDEELALWLAKFTDCSECPISAYPHCTTSEESCACRWHEWLKEEVSE